MPKDKLDTYRRKRDADRTPEPVPAQGPLPAGNDDTFVIQEHHARRLHWDVRLERDGVLVSWAVPKGLPLDPRTNHLAVHTEDHPLEYAAFEGDIPRGEYGGGKVILWDRGHYELEEWTDREVKVVFRGSRAKGRYVFFHTRGDDWIVHRMDPPPTPGWQPPPERLRPMRPVAGDLPDEDGWSYEMAWGGERVIVTVEGGRARIDSSDGDDLAAVFPELRGLGPALGSRVCVLDAEVVVLDSAGRPSPSLLAQRLTADTDTQARRGRSRAPATLLVSDLLHLDGRDTTGLSYAERRSLLEELPLHGTYWEVPPAFPRGSDALAASRDLGLPGVLAKQLDSPYETGKRGAAWRRVSNRGTHEVLVGGWLPGESETTPAAVLVGVRDDAGLRYVGTVRAGLTAARRAELAGVLRRYARKTPPFTAGLPTGTDARWLRPALAGVVVAAGWTRDERLRYPTWRGLRTEKA
jgi:bifunctional non-homologous end joining protein LigD